LNGLANDPLDVRSSPASISLAEERIGEPQLAVGRDPRLSRFKIVDASPPEVATSSSVKAKRAVDSLFDMLTPKDGHPPIEGGVWKFDEPRLYGLPDGSGTVRLSQVEVGRYDNNDLKAVLTLSQPTKISKVDGMVTSIELRDNAAETKLTYFQNDQYLLSRSFGHKVAGGLGGPRYPTAFEPTLLSARAQPWGSTPSAPDAPSMVRVPGSDQRVFRFDTPADIDTSFGTFETSERTFGRTTETRGKILRPNGYPIHLLEDQHGAPFNPEGTELPPNLLELWDHQHLYPTPMMPMRSLQIAEDGTRAVRELGWFEQLQGPGGAVLKESTVAIKTNGLWVNAHLNVPQWGDVYYGRTGLYNPTRGRPEIIVKTVDGQSRIIRGTPSELTDILPPLTDSK